MKADDESSDSVSEREELTKVQNINLFCFFVVVFVLVKRHISYQT